MTKKVKIYDLQSGWEKWKADAPEEYRDLVVHEHCYVVQGTKGVLVSEQHEGVHYVYEGEGAMDSKYPFHLYEATRHEGGHSYVSTMPEAEACMPIHRIVEDCTFTETELKDMVRCFGRRLDYNWDVLLKSLRKIGVRLSEYDTSRE